MLYAHSDWLLILGIVCAIHLLAKQIGFPLCFAGLLSICSK